MSAESVGFPKELVAYGDKTIRTVMGLPVGSMEAAKGAEEVVRRWNAFEELTSALRDLVTVAEGYEKADSEAAEESGEEPYVAPRLKAARAALRKAGVS